jgi:hypothetical protein
MEKPIPTYWLRQGEGEQLTAGKPNGVETIDCKCREMLEDSNEEENKKTTHDCKV